LGLWLGEADREAEQQPLAILQGEEQIEEHRDRLCEFRFNPAGDSDLIPATIPI
jgi:hypothetical protein